MARYITAGEARELLSPVDSIRLAQEAFRLYGIEREVLSNPAAAFTIVKNDVPTMFWAKAASFSTLGVAGCFFGAQFGDYYFNMHDCETGELLAIVEQSWLVKRRTAATGVVAARQLARPDSRVATLIGPGQIGTEVARLLPLAFDLEELRVVSRTLEGAERFAGQIGAELGIPVKAYASAEEAVAGSDIVVTITLAEEPVLKPGWIRPGTTICSMGGVHEIDFGVLKEIDMLVVDDLDSALLRGDLAVWVEQGSISRNDMIEMISADIGQLVNGDKPGRASPDQTILAVIQGMASCDLIVAKHLYDRACEKGIGHEFPVQRQMQRPDSDRLEVRSQSIAGGLQRRRQRAATRA